MAGGVIAVRHDRDDINSIHDLKDKVVAAGGMIDLMGGQMQMYEMIKEGLSYVNDPKQFVFTLNQEDVVLGVLDGRYDVGFIRTGQIEATKGRNGNYLDPELFKIIETKDYILENGELFPFIHSTETFAEWPFAALPDVPAEVQRAVQDALLQFGDFLDIGNTIKACLDSGGNATFCHLDNLLGLTQGDFSIDIPCEATNDLVLMAAEAGVRAPVGGFRTALSYHELRSIQEETGILIHNDNGDSYCTKPSNLYGGIQCPEGFFKVGLDGGTNCVHAHCSDDSRVLLSFYSVTKSNSTMGAVTSAYFATSRQPTPASANPASKLTKLMCTNLTRTKRILIFSTSMVRNIQDAVRCQFVPKSSKRRPQHSESSITGHGTTPKSSWRYMLATKSRSFQ